ncbi:MAG: NPCBM/NEW2 domain-containing protein [Planctomycetes bacterium]|nr:NPCBM/NEW2 domain-containing protein [Planctomycetota bacterium]
MLAALTLATLPGLVLAPSGSAHAGSAAAPPRAAADAAWVLEDLDGSQRRVPVAGGASGALELGEALFLRVEQGAGHQAPEAPVGRALQLDLAGAAGSLVGVLRGGDGERLRASLPGGSLLEVPIEGLRALRLPAALEGRDGRPEPAEEGDRLYLIRGDSLDRLDGLLAGFSAEGVLFEGPLGEATHAWAEVAALFVEPLEVLEPEGGGRRVEVSLVGGGRLRGLLAGLDGDGARLDLGPVEVALGLTDLDELAVVSERYAFLGDLEPADLGPLSPFDDGEPLGQAWLPQVDRSVVGGPLRVGGRTWGRGLGVHAPSRVRWDLDGGWDRLRLRVGLDDSGVRGLRRGRARFRVRVDGEVRWESAEVEAGAAAQVAPPVDLRGAKVLELEVEPGADWVLDRANWLRPLLVRG